MQKSVIVKKKLMNINIKNIFATLFKKQKHLKLLLQTSFFFSAVMHNAKQVTACIEFMK